MGGFCHVICCSSIIKDGNAILPIPKKTNQLVNVNVEILLLNVGEYIYVRSAFMSYYV